MMSFLFSLLFALLFLCYSNTFNASWQFDDYKNIVHRDSIHLADFSVDSIRKSMEGSFSIFSLLSKRSLSYLSFALNWYVGKNDPFGYHIVNFIIHFLNTVLLFFVSKKILILNGFVNDKFVCWVSYISSFFWSIHPIQIQSVTYVVQRMNSLCAFFYLLSLFAFFSSYYRAQIKTKILYWTISVGCGVLAVACKQNGVLIFFAVPLVVVCFGAPWNSKRDNFIRCFAAGIFSLGIVLFFVDAFFNWSGYYEYGHRTFSMFERILTQPRVIFFYIRQIFLPHFDLFSIAHSVKLPNSLIDPWTTLPSAVGIVAIILAGAFAVIRGARLIGFSILFFFINHLVESTALPLELIYEHRNYIPSFFLFLCVTIEVVLFAADGRNHDYKKVTAVALTLCTLIYLGATTYFRNKDWLTPRSLWLSAIEHAPDQARVYQNLSLTYSNTTQKGLMQSLRLNEFAENLWDPDKKDAKYFSIRNIGGAYAEFGDYARSVPFLIEAYKIKKYPKDALLIAKIFFRIGDLKSSMLWIEELKGKSLSNNGIRSALRIQIASELNNGDIKSARKSIARAIHNNMKKDLSSLYLSFVYLLQSDNQKALSMLSRIKKPNLLSDSLQLHLLDKMGKHLSAEKLSDDMKNKYSMGDVNKFRDSLKSPTILPLPDYATGIIESLLLHRFGPGAFYSSDCGGNIGV